MFYKSAAVAQMKSHCLARIGTVFDFGWERILNVSLELELGGTMR